MKWPASLDAVVAAKDTEVAAGGVVFRRVTAGFEVAIADQQDRISGEATFRLPKGKVDPGETLEETARREVAEETGLEVRILEPLREQRYEYLDLEGRRVPKLVHFFLMEHASGDPAPRDGEFERVFWCPIEEAGVRLTFPGERRAVDEARSRLTALFQNERGSV